MKGINLKVVADLIHKSWDEISKETLRKSWRKILPITGSLCASSGIKLYSDAEICDIVSRSDEIHPEEEKEAEEEEDDDEEPCLISNSEAAYMFERCLLCLEHQPEATVYNSMTLRDLKTMASKKQMKSLKQTSITKYFI